MSVLFHLETITQRRPERTNMADKTAGPSTSSETHVDFASLPASALDSYIAYYGLAKTYPPPPTKRSPSPSDNFDEEKPSEDHGVISQLGSRRESRTRNGGGGGEDAHMTSSRLRPRSPSSSVAHLYGLGRRSGDDGVSDGMNGQAAEHEDDPSPSHFFDVQEADEYLAGVASKHFAAQPPPKEGEVVVQFLYRCRASDKCLKVAS